MEQKKLKVESFEEKPIMEKMDMILNQIENLKKLLANMPTISEQVEELVNTQRHGN